VALVAILVVSGPRVGLALSGGGFRAAAFGLGCLRALHDKGVLGKVTVVSGISGGSLLAAMWAYGPKDFTAFDDQITALLRTGLQRRLVLSALAPTHVGRSVAGLVSRAILGAGDRPSHNRTDLLADLLARQLLGDRNLRDVTQPNLATVLTATDLTTARTVRFGSLISASSQHGVILDPIRVADAVAASAAFPILLPAMQRTFTFERRGVRTRRTVALTDGGVYDNLGLTVLEPGRNPAYTAHVYPVDYVVACDAGRQERGDSTARRWPRRLQRSFDITYRKTQDGGRARLFGAEQSGEIDGFVHAYLGMRDEHLPVPIPGLVPMSRVNRYPTNFAAMSVHDLCAVTTRGEQLTSALLQHYCPGLLG
jgi:predicted acylesterase/phospholipase RssA